MDRSFGLSRNIKLFFLMIIMGLTLVNFQNCGRGFRAIEDEADSLGSRPDVIQCNTENCVTVLPPTTCAFDDLVLQNGESVTAFFATEAPDCVSEVRTCTNGFLSGNYQFSSCTPIEQGPSDCIWGDGTIADGVTVTAFRNFAVAEGQACEQEIRTCNDGVLSGTYNHESCTVADANACSIDGQVVLNGDSIIAYQNPTVPLGNQCVSQSRECNNGVLSGSFAHTSCQVDQFISCFFSGNFVDHNESVVAFQNSTVPFGESCVQENRTCSDGALSGSYQHRTCNVDAPAVCSFDGADVAHGESVTAYLNSNVAFGEDCGEEQRTCTDGVLSGSHVFSSCVVDQPNSCLFFGRTLAHGEEVTAFEVAGVGFGESCASETRTCDNGVMTGGFAFETCTVSDPLACTFNGSTVAHGEAINAFETGGVSFGETCNMEERTCVNGLLTGDFAFASCTEGTPSACVVDGQTIPHNQIINTFAQSRVPAGETCTPMVEQCVNGVMSGTGSFLSCSVNRPDLPNIVEEPTVLSGNITINRPNVVILDPALPLPNNDLVQCLGGVIDLNPQAGTTDVLEMGGLFVSQGAPTINLNTGDLLRSRTTQPSDPRCSPGPAVSNSNSIRVRSLLRITGELVLDGVSLIIESGGQLVVESGSIVVGRNSSRPSALYILSGAEVYLPSANSRIGLLDVDSVPQSFGYVFSAGTIYSGANITLPSIPEPASDSGDDSGSESEPEASTAVE